MFLVHVFLIPLVVTLIHNGEIRKEEEIKNVEFIPREDVDFW